MILIIALFLLLLLLPSQAIAAITPVACVANTDCAPTIRTAIKAATPGDTIRLNAGTHLISSPMLIDKSLNLRGAGMAQTILEHKVEIQFDGGAGMLLVGGMPGVVSGVTISGLTFRGDRVANPNMRMIMIRIRSRSENVIVDDVGFQNCSSSCVVINGWYVKNVSVLNSRAEEYYEQFVEISGGESHTFRVANNYAASSKGHPKLGTTKPFPVMLTPGHAGGGFLDRVSIVNNVFDHTKMIRAEAYHTAGVQISEDRQRQGAKFGFNNVFITGNKMMGLARAVTIQLFRTPGFISPPSYIAIENNEMRKIILEPIHIKAHTSTTPADSVFLGDNQFFEASKPYKIENLTATILKKNNSCLVWRNEDKRKNKPGYWTQAAGCN